MAKKMVFSCDKCGKEVNSQELVEIDVTTRNIKIKGCDGWLGHSPLHIEICKDCISEYGFKIEPAENNSHVAEQNRMTLEDKMFDILQDLGVCFGQ